MVSGYKKSEIGLVPNDWDVLPFGEVFRTLSNNTLSRDQLNYDSGSIKDVHYGDVLILFPELLDCSRDDIPYVNSDAPLFCQSLQEGDVIISDTAEDETVGKAVEIVNQGKTNIVAGLHTIPCRVKNGKFASGWLGYFINSHYYHDQLLPYIHGTKVSSIARKSLADTYIVKPSYEEQKRIVKALSDIGRLISESEELIAKYQAMKQGCLQHMFPRKVQTEPDMRLPGFSGDWEQRKVQQLIDDGLIEAPMDGNHGEKHPKATDYVSYGIPFLMAADIRNGKIDLHNCKFISKERSERLDKGFAKNGDVLITHKATIGETALLQGLTEEYAVLTPQVTYYRGINKPKLSPLYLYYCFQSSQFQREMKEAAGQSTRAYIGIQQQHDLSIYMPINIKEQKALGQFFSDLDNLITLHQRKCEKYKMIKQGMMEDLLTGKVRLK